MDQFGFKRYPEIFPGASLFGDGDSIDFTDSRQGNLGNCYIKAAMGSLAEFPEMVRAAFLNQNSNENGIYNVRFYIRGKPWIVSVDDYLFYADTDPASLMYGFQSQDNKSMWGAILEKAWSKVKGNYLNTESGYTINGLRALTGLPVFFYVANGDMDDLDNMW